MTKKGRCVGKQHVMGYARSKTPSIGDRPGKLPFKEVKRRAILAGLRCMKAPAVIALLVNAIFAMPSLQWGPSHEISHLELFAGECAVTRGEFQEGRTDSIALDITHDPATMDLTTPTGFLTACYHATCLRVGSGLLAAPVCSSFVYMSSGTSQRSHAQPLGQTKHRFTMGSYGSPSEKPTWVYSSEDAVQELGKFKPVFGIALARLRSHHAARIKAQAVKTIKKNVKNYRSAQLGMVRFVLKTALKGVVGMAKSSKKEKTEKKKVTKVVSKPKASKRCEKAEKKGEDREKSQKRKQDPPTDATQVAKKAKKEKTAQSQPTKKASKKSQPDKIKKTEARETKNVIQPPTQQPARRLSGKTKPEDAIPSTPSETTAASPCKELFPDQTSGIASPAVSLASLQAWKKEANGRGLSLEEYMEEVSAKQLETSLEAHMTQLVAEQAQQAKQAEDAKDASSDSTDSSDDEGSGESDEDDDGEGEKTNGEKGEDSEEESGSDGSQDSEDGSEMDQDDLGGEEIGEGD
eukprot:s1968_g31.t1